MTEYQKIETLFKFDNATKTYLPEFYNPYVEYLKDNAWICSEKIDGTNVQVEYDGHRVSFHGRTERTDFLKEVLAVLSETFADSEVEFEQLFGDKHVILFMECYGGKIQGGLYGGKERLIGFDVMVNGCYLDKMTIKDIFDKFGVETIKFFTVKKLDYAIDIVKNIAAYPQDSYHISTHCEKNYNESRTTIEGLVCVPAMRIYDHQGKRIIVKIKARDMKKPDTTIKAPKDIVNGYTELGK